MNITNRKHYLIYQITNLINGKIYIGKHITTNIEDNYFGSGINIQRAINKYGLENFIKTILFELQNEEEMNLLEKCVVTPEFCTRKDTYNIMEGGQGGWNYVQSITTSADASNKAKCGWIKFKQSNTYNQVIENKRIKQKKYYETHDPPNKGVKMSIEKRQQLSKSKKQFYQSNLSPAAGTMHVHDIYTGKNLTIKRIDDLKFLPDNLALGWISDNFKWTQERKEKYKNDYKNGKFKNGMTGKKLKDCMTSEKYIEWKNKHKGKQSSKKGSIIIHKNNTTKFIAKDQLNEYLANGWSIGMTDWNYNNRMSIIQDLRPIYAFYIQNEFNWELTKSQFSNRFLDTRKHFIWACRTYLPEYKQRKTFKGTKRGPYKKH